MANADTRCSDGEGFRSILRAHEGDSMTTTGPWEQFSGESGAVWRYRPDLPLGPPGGFGGVFAGEAADGSPVAVKVVKRARLGGELDPRLLRREVEIGRRIGEVDAPMLLAVRDAAESSEGLLLVLERAERSLAGVTGQLDEDRSTLILIDVATALQQLHTAGIIHRDLKPGNVLMHEGRWKLADFGIARDAEIGTQTATFLGWGSRPYMAPELWEGRSPSVKTDLYALGCLAYELLTGETPFKGDQRAGHLGQPAPPAQCENAMLRTLIARLLAKDAGERPQDARSVLERLSRSRLGRTHEQEQIAQLGSIHAAERANEAVTAQDAAAVTEMVRQLRVQGLAELTELLTDSLERIQVVEPDATLEKSSDVAGNSFMISTIDASLLFEVWEEVPGGSSLDDDTMALGGGITLRNRRLPQGILIGNAAYESVNARYGWYLYQFTAASTSAYKYGPTDRPHGLVQRQFLDPQQRHVMLNPVTHDWRKTTLPLGEDAVLDLFIQALALKSVTRP